MSGLTRRRVTAMLSLLAGTGGLASPAWAQEKQEKKQALPDCPVYRETLGAWRVFANEDGAIISPAKPRLVAGSNWCETSREDIIQYYPKTDTWSLTLRPSSLSLKGKLIVSVANGANSPAGFEIAASDVKFSSSAKCYRMTPRVTPEFRRHIDPEAGRGPITIELTEDGQQLFKVEIETTGFATAVAASKTEFAKAKALLDAKKCEPADCYLTTLCVREIGLPDDCFELRTLRAFRDGPMRALREGPDLIARYYEIAPRICAEIARRGEHRRLLAFYPTHILPAVMLARLGRDRLALAVYRDMTRRLEARYLG